MRKAKPIVLLFALLFATLGGCLGPLMARQSMSCCSSMPCSPASRSMSCCSVNLPGAASYIQQSEKVTAPTFAYAVHAVLPRISSPSSELSATIRDVGFDYYSPPGGLYTIHHSFLI
jgi:hypothetical protein